MQANTFAGGNASVANLGSVAQFLQANTFTGGNATGTNGGSVGQFFQVNTFAGGNATAINGGTVAQFFNVATFAGGNASATNSGLVLGGSRITAAGGSGSLTNLGVITDTGGGPAIQFFGGPDTLTNVIGSRVIGAINLVGNQDTVNFVGGNWLFTFNSLANATINTNGAPFVVAGNTVAVLDPTAFALADRSLMNFTGGISQLLQSRFNGMPSGPGGTTATSFAATNPGIADQAQAAFAGIPSIAMAYASDPRRKMFVKAPPAVPYYDTVIWASGFGGQRRQDADGPILHATDTAYGAAMGIDRVFGPGLRLGAFVGGGTSRQRIDFDPQSTDTDYVFGGGYGRLDQVSRYFDVALYAGNMNNRSTRQIANNLVPNGLEIATASYGGWFISPDVTFGVRFPVMDFMITPRARVRFVAGTIDGYTETGSAQNLSVGSRSIDDAEERLEVEFSRVAPVSWGGTIKTTANAGVIGLQRFGDNVSTVLLTQALSFTTPGRASAVGGVAGAGLDYRPTPNVGIFVAAEGTAMNDKSVTGVAKGGVRVAF